MNQRPTRSMPCPATCDVMQCHVSSNVICGKSPFLTDVFHKCMSAQESIPTHLTWL